MKQYILNITILLCLSSAVFAQKGKVGIRPAGSGTNVYSTTSAYTTTSFLQKGSTTVSLSEVKNGDMLLMPKIGNEAIRTGSIWTKKYLDNGLKATSRVVITGSGGNFTPNLEQGNRFYIGSSSNVEVLDPDSINFQSQYEVFVISVKNTGGSPITVNWSSITYKNKGGAGAILEPLDSFTLSSSEEMAVTFQLINVGEVNALIAVDDINRAWAYEAISAAGGSNLAYTPSTGVVSNDNGTGFTIPLGDGANRGLMPSIPGLGGPITIDPDFDKLLGWDDSGNVNMAPTVRQVVESLKTGIYGGSDSLSQTNTYVAMDSSGNKSLAIGYFPSFPDLSYYSPDYGIMISKLYNGEIGLFDRENWFSFSSNRSAVWHTELNANNYHEIHSVGNNGITLQGKKAGVNYSVRMPNESADNASGVKTLYVYTGGSTPATPTPTKIQNGAISGTTDGSGDITVTIPAMGDATYSPTVTVSGTTLGIGVTVHTLTTTSFKVRFYDTNTKAALTSTAVTGYYNLMDY